MSNTIAATTSSPYQEGFSSATDQLALHCIVVPMPADVAGYVASHPALGQLLPALCARARQLFGSARELSLELYKDPEFDDCYLTLYMRQEEYPQDTMDRIEAVRRHFDEALEKVSGQLLITTDFRRPRGSNGV